MSNITDTLSDYHKRINNALVYINKHLDSCLDLNTLAGISNFSPFHFHRIMRAHLSEPLGAYIVRVRLDTAAKLIQYTSEPLHEIAGKVGYETPAAFSTAFKKRFNITPSDFRNHKNNLEMNTDFLSSEQPPVDVKLKPIMKTLKPKTVIYIRIIGSYSDKAIPAAWLRLWDFAKKKHLLVEGMESLGVSHDDPNVTELEKCRYDSCITVNKEVQPEDEIGIQEIQGGRYAAFKHKGSYDQLGMVYNAIFRDWLPGSGCELRNVPVFEKYLNSPNNTKPEKLLTEIYVPVK